MCEDRELIRGKHGRGGRGDGADGAREGGPPGHHEPRHAGYQDARHRTLRPVSPLDAKKLYIHSFIY